jgi:hypothetical protein
MALLSSKGNMVITLCVSQNSQVSWHSNVLWITRLLLFMRFIYEWNAYCSWVSDNLWKPCSATTAKKRCQAIANTIHSFSSGTYSTKHWTIIKVAPQNIFHCIVQKLSGNENSGIYNFWISKKMSSSLPSLTVHRISTIGRVQNGSRGTTIWTKTDKRQHAIYIVEIQAIYLNIWSGTHYHIHISTNSGNTG